MPLPTDWQAKMGTTGGGLKHFAIHFHWYRTMTMPSAPFLLFPESLRLPPLL